MARSESGDGDSCEAAVMAAMEAIGEHCGDERIPVEAEDGLVVMAPKDDLQRVRARAEGGMSDEQLMQMMEDSVWMGDWTASLCSSAGHEEGTGDYRECRLRFARQVLEN